MQTIPAIDILGGKCARLRRGDYDSAQVFADCPAQMARQFCQLGARRIHVVDLDAAKSGKRDNAAAVADIIAVCREFNAQIQIGGGLRDLPAIQNILSAGATFAIIGTAAIQQPDFLAAAVNEFPGQIILAADARDGRIAVAGWCEESPLHVYELLDSAATQPPAAIIFTDIGQDGMMRGVNVEMTQKVAARAPCPLIASGGVRGETDMQLLSGAKNIVGAIIGRAVYENMSILQPLLARYG